MSCSKPTGVVNPIAVLSNPFCSEIQNTVDLGVSGNWVSYVQTENGRVKSLSECFFANIWCEFWYVVKPDQRVKFEQSLVKLINSDGRFKTENDEFWKEQTSKDIARLLGWNESFFRNYPWYWPGMTSRSVRNMCERYQPDRHTVDPDQWLIKQPKRATVSKQVDDLITEFKGQMHLGDKTMKGEQALLKFERLQLDEDKLSPTDKYAINSLKLEYNALKEREIPRFVIMDKVSRLIRGLEKDKKIRGEDKAFQFQIGCSDDKTSQWNALMRYKGYVGEMIFTYCFPDIWDDIPEEMRFINGVEVIPKDTKFEFVSESGKMSGIEILKNVAEQKGAQIVLPTVSCLHFPDFHTTFSTEDSQIHIVTFFECTYSTVNSVKLKKDALKWESFVKEFNRLNSKGKERDLWGFDEPTIFIQVVPLNVKMAARTRKHLPNEIGARMDLIQELTCRYNQGVLSHENSNIIKTIHACEQLKVHDNIPRQLDMDQDVLKELEDKVNADVEKDTGVPNYVELLEKEMGDEEADEFENNLVEELKKTLKSDVFLNQKKWIETTPKSIIEGVCHLEDTMFNKERIMRLVSNNHHDSSQFSTLSEGVDLSETVQTEFFDKFSDLLEGFSSRYDANLKPTLCIMVCASAGLPVYLTNNYQFGECSGFLNKSNRISQTMKVLESKWPNDARVRALREFNLNNVQSHKIWKVGDYSLGQFQSGVVPVLQEMILKKKKIDFNYRYTQSNLMDRITSDNYKLVEEVCCKDQVFRYEHSSNEIWITCPSHETRYRVNNPFEQLDSVLNKVIDERNCRDSEFSKDAEKRTIKIDPDSFSEQRMIDILIKVIEGPDTNIFLRSHCLHFLSGFVSFKKVIKIVIKNLINCHSYYQKMIIKTLNKRNFDENQRETLSNHLGEVMNGHQMPTERLKLDAASIMEEWYRGNTEYLHDPMSKSNLQREITAVAETNPLAVCYAHLAEQMIKTRSHHFSLHKSAGHVNFSKTFGPIFSSSQNPDSESIRCFALSEGHFFVNHRTLRMLQGLPLLLISNKLIVDKMASRECVPGNYSHDDLVQFCLLNSRRLNVNLQNIRYFFMACWSCIHSPFMFKKLEMDFLKTSEFQVCRKIIKFIKKVCCNVRHLNGEKETEVVDKFPPLKSFPVLFNHSVQADLNNTDLCLHSFYMVHLFEKTISGKVQEILKVYEKFLKPKLAWHKDLIKYKNKTLTKEEMNRFLMSDGLNKCFTDDLKNVIQDCLSHKNKYAGFNLDFVKCAAKRYVFSQNRYAQEMRMPHSVSELLRATSTVKKFNTRVDFNKMCDNIDLQKKISDAMKTIDTEMLKQLSDKIFVKSETKHSFQKCISKLNNIKRTDADDLTMDEVSEIDKVLKGIRPGNIQKTQIDLLDDLLSKTNYVQICENYEFDCHDIKTNSEAQAGVFLKYLIKFPNFSYLIQDNPIFGLLMYFDGLSADIDSINSAFTMIGEDGEKTTENFELAIHITQCKSYAMNPDAFQKYSLSSMRKERTPRNRMDKKRLQSLTKDIANPRHMTTALINDILNVMNSDIFSDTYSICKEFKFNSNFIIFGMAFKEQFGGERELTIGDIWSKLTLKLVEDIARDLGRCMKNTCLNEPSNEVEFKKTVIRTQQDNYNYGKKQDVGVCSPYYYGSIDRSKWGPFHQGLSFYAVLRVLIKKSPGENEDVLDIVKYACLKHGLKHFEIHHNVAMHIVRKAIRKGILRKESARWSLSGRDQRPDIKMEDWEMFTLKELIAGRKSVHTRMDMGQGMLHSCSDVYGAVIDEYIKRIISKVIDTNKVDIESMNTSDDRSSITLFSGDADCEGYLGLLKKTVFLEDVLQRLGNMYISEKSVWSTVINEFKSSFMRNGLELRVLVKFVSTQLTIGKDCFPEDYWNTYNSLTKQVLCNGGSQMMCDLLYLSKLHLMQSAFTFSKTPFADCVREAPPSRFGFPNLTSVDIYFHTSRHILATRAVHFLNKCGFQGDILTIKNDRKESGQSKLIQLRRCDDFVVPRKMTAHNGTQFFTVALKDKNLLDKEENDDEKEKGVDDEESEDVDETQKGFITSIKLHDSTKRFFLHHKEQLSFVSLEDNLFKFFTLTRNPGLSDSESICGGVNTLLPSQRGKRFDSRTIDHVSMKSMSYLDYFIMTNLPLTMRSATLRSTQALYQSLKEEAKRAHQNMIFGKSIIINKGNFCFVNRKLVTQRYAFNNFNCDDSEFKCIKNLIWKLHDAYKVMRREVITSLNRDNTYTIELRSSSCYHEEKSIPLHSKPEIALSHNPLVIRAYYKVSKNEETIEDAHILANSIDDPIKLDDDIRKFGKFYTGFSDTELIMLDLGRSKKVLEGVYMFEQCPETNSQIRLILEGCIHNHIQRNVEISREMVKETEMNIKGIQKVLLFLSVLTTGTADPVEVKSKLSKLLRDHEELLPAITEGMDHPTYSRICATVLLFLYPSSTSASQHILDQFKMFKNLEETGSMMTRIIKGDFNGIRFKYIKDYHNETSVTLYVAPSSGSTLKELKKTVQCVLAQDNEEIQIIQDPSLESDLLVKSSQDTKVTVEYRNSKFVIILMNTPTEEPFNFFAPSKTLREMSERWNKCLEVTCVTPIINEISTLWNLLQEDDELRNAINNQDFSELAIQTYTNQFDDLRKIIIESRDKGQLNKVKASMLVNSQAFEHVVVRDVVADGDVNVRHLCPEELELRSSPFDQVFLLSKLVINAKSIHEVMDFDNFMSVMKDHKNRVTKLPVIKFQGMQVSQMGIFEPKDIEDIIKLNQFGDSVEDSSFKFNDVGVSRIFGSDFNKKRYMIFNPGVSIKSLFRLQEKNSNVYIQIIDNRNKSVRVWICENTGNSAEKFDALLRSNSNFRYSVIITEPLNAAKKSSVLLEF